MTDFPLEKVDESTGEIKRLSHVVPIYKPLDGSDAKSYKKPNSGFKKWFSLNSQTDTLYISFLRDSSITPQAKVVWHLIAASMGPNNASGLSIASIADALGANKQHTSRLVSKLIAGGYLIDLGLNGLYQVPPTMAYQGRWDS